MKVSARNKVIKFLSLFAITFLAFAMSFTSFTALATENGVFELKQGASLRYPTVADEVVNGVEKRYSGLRFQTEVDEDWFNSNRSDKYQFGTLIYPATNGVVDKSAPLEYNELNLDAVIVTVDEQFVKEHNFYYASIVYDVDYIKEILINKGVSENDPEFDDKVEKALNIFYDMEMTAVSFVKYDETVLYTDSYSTSVRKVAARLALDPKWSDAASTYLGDTVIGETQKVYSTDRTMAVDGLNLENLSKIVLNNDVVDSSNYTIQGGKIVFSEEFFLANRGERTFYLFDSENNLAVITAHLGDIIITSVR